jgi:hypothetical protein
VNADDPRRAPQWALIVDVICVLALVLAAGVAAGDGIRVRVLGWRIAITSPYRILAWAIGAAGVRHLLVPNPPIHRNLRARVAAWRASIAASPQAVRLLENARAPLPAGEANLFERSGGGPGAIVEWCGVFLAFSLLVAAFTWPQLRHMDSVPDLGDPLFSIWRLSWINHQLLRNPLSLFDGNTFFPERFTLTYSDPVLISALLSAPLFWLGIDGVLIYNIVFLAAWVVSGAAMYLLARALTGRRDAAAIAGVVFTLYPYRFDHYSHLELQMTLWMPIALWALHRTLARSRIADALAAGGAFVLQMLSSLYYGAYFAIYLIVVGGAMWAGRHFPTRPAIKLAAGAALAAVLIAPVVSVYRSGKAVVGERNDDAVKDFSAIPRDYLEPHFRARVYQRFVDDRLHERQLFPNVTTVAVALIGAWPPMTAATIAYTTGVALTFDASLGMNGMVFPWLRAYVPGYRSVRVPPRFSMLLGMTLAILCGYGAARLFTRWPRHRAVILVAIAGAMMIEALPDIRLVPVWKEPPAIYGSLSAASPRVLAEFPSWEQTGDSGMDTRYIYFSTFHWQTLVNGYSGYFPPSYIEFQHRTRDFPSEASLQYLRERGVEYISWHGAFSKPGRAERTAAILDARPDLELVAKAPWQGSESRLYRLR